MQRTAQGPRGWTRRGGTEERWETEETSGRAQRGGGQDAGGEYQVLSHFIGPHKVTRFASAGGSRGFPGRILVPVEVST